MCIMYYFDETSPYVLYWQFAYVVIVDCIICNMRAPSLMENHVHSESLAHDRAHPNYYSSRSNRARRLAHIVILVFTPGMGGGGGCNQHRQQASIYACSTKTQQRECLRLAYAESDNVTSRCYDTQLHIQPCL